MLQNRNESFRPMYASLPNVLISVCTFERPKMLETCLLSLIGQKTNYGFLHSIAVIDNDPAGSAHRVFANISQQVPDILPMHYLHERTRGIARARNKALNFARENGFTHVAFIDDDEIAMPDWLFNLMHSDYAGVHMVAGKRNMDFSRIPAWAQPKHKKPDGFMEGQRLSIAATNNLLIGPELINSPIRFNERLGLGGGEDTEFTQEAVRQGYQIRYTKRAVTVEYAHPARMTIRGQAYRTFWITAANLSLEIKRKGWLGACPKCIPTIIGSWFHGPALIAIGCLLIPFNGHKGRKLILRGAKLLAKGQGYLAGLVGYTPQVYAKTVGG